MAPSVCNICASIARQSSVNSRSPLLTWAPSRKWTPTMVVSTRALMATLAIGVTVPSASSWTGTFSREALAVSTWTTRAGGALARAASVLDVP
jgi:hypothetical protein